MPSDRDKLRARFRDATEDELRALIATSRSSELQRSTAHEELQRRGLEAPARAAPHDPAHAPAEPVVPVPGPDEARAPGGGSRIALVLVGLGLLLTQGIRLWSREQQNAARWDETVRAIETQQRIQREVDAVDLDPAVVEAIARGEAIVVDARGRFVVPGASPAPEADPSALLEARCALEVLECIAAGLAFERGERVAIDVDRALSYYDRACAGGLEDGCERANALRVTPSHAP